MAITYEPLATLTLTTSAVNISFTSIATSYTSLRVILLGKHTSDGNTNYAKFNNDNTTNNYNSVNLFTRSTSSTVVINGQSDGSSGQNVGHYLGGSASYPFFVEMNIVGASQNGTYYNKVVMNQWADGRHDSSNQAGIMLNSGTYRNNNPITQITITPSSGNFDVGTSATLYGITRA